MLKQVAFNVNLAPDRAGTPIPSRITSFHYSYSASSSDISIPSPSGQDFINTLDAGFGGIYINVRVSPLPETQVGDVVTVSLTVSMTGGASCSATGSIEVRD